ncbi:hypothetical protein Tco_0004540 [Tanacetum coccineum]
MEKLENENVSLEFQVQSLIKEQDSVKLEYQKLFDSIKKTWSQSKKEMDKLIDHVSEKTYAYGPIRAKNHNLLSTISESKTRLETVEKDLEIWVLSGAWGRSLLVVRVPGPARLDGLTRRHGYAVSSLMDTAYWSSE